MYIAKHYVRLNGRTYSPGEVLDALPDSAEERLLRLGAVERVREAVQDGDNTKGPDASAFDDDADMGKSPNASAFDGPDIPHEDGQTEDVPTEIDVMDGIVSTPKSKSGRGKKHEGQNA